MISKIEFARMPDTYQHEFKIKYNVYVLEINDVLGLTLLKNTSKRALCNYLVIKRKQTARSD